MLLLGFGTEDISFGGCKNDCDMEKAKKELEDSGSDPVKESLENWPERPLLFSKKSLDADKAREKGFSEAGPALAVNMMDV